PSLWRRHVDLAELPGRLGLDEPAAPADPGGAGRDQRGRARRPNRPRRRHPRRARRQPLRPRRRALGPATPRRAVGRPRARRRHPSADAARALGVAVSAERSAWASGRPGLFPPGFGPSPWFRAHVLAQAGRLDTARGLLVQALERGAGRWAPPEGATPAQLRPLVA